MTDVEKVTLREYTDLRFIELEKRLESIDKLNQIAIDKAVITQLRDSAFTFAMRTDVKALELSAAKLDGKADQRSVDKVFIMSGLSLLIAIITFVLKL